MKTAAGEATHLATLSAERLRGVVEQIFVSAGAPPETAGIVADSLVLSNLKGVDSHGFIRVVQYVGEIESGTTDPRAVPQVERQGPLVRVSGNRCFGQLAGRQAAREALAACGAHGVSVVAVAGVRHMGRIGEYVELVSDGGCIAIAFSNCGPPHGRVAPTGGRESRFGTNPIAYAVPAGRHPAVIADFSTAALAEGKVRLAHQNGSRIPTGLVVDANGRPTTDPGALYAGGAILPFGGHKGYALSLLVELLSGGIGGSGSAAAGDDPGNGMMLVAVDPRFFAGPAYTEAIDRIVDAVSSTPAASRDEDVLIPGEIEARTEAHRRREGIPLPPATWAELVDVARRLGVAVEEVEQ